MCVLVCGIWGWGCERVAHVNPIHSCYQFRAPAAVCRRICNQCTGLTELFNVYHHCSSYVRRHLDAMLILVDEDRHHYSFLSQGPDLPHGPLAVAAVDPAVVHLDFDCAPPDRWHALVNMIDSLTGVVREQLIKDKKAQVSPLHETQTQSDTARATHTAVGDVGVSAGD